ncbi:MAG: hypothetical protein V1831_02455 [Candidatus Woesearchaeota archaeon]
MVKKEIIFALMILSIFLISACDVYKTLYAQQPKGGEEVSVESFEGNIITDTDGEELITGIEDIEINMEEEDAEVEEVENIMEETPEDATVIIVEETELVSLVPKAEDPDKDVLTFTFTSPLDANGEWQTNYGDAGEYTVTATASDSLLTASKEVLIIVNRKEEAPVLESFKPESTIVEIGETDIVSFKVIVSDLNNDELIYSWKLDGIEIGNDDSIEYLTTYEDSGAHTVKVSVSDGMFDTEKIWSITVNNVNREPLLEGIDDMQAEETDTIIVVLEASDPDGDELSYEIDDKRFVQDGNVFTWETTYDDAGTHLIKATVSDGVDTTSQEFTVTIENVNRAPVILDIVQKQ